MPYVPMIVPPQAGCHQRQGVYHLVHNPVPVRPAGFAWRGHPHRIVEKLAEWHDYRRRGRMAHNMRRAHAAIARRGGSWGVGRDYYRVRTNDGRVFDLYYDRAPKHAGDRTGEWFLYREMGEEDREAG